MHSGAATVQKWRQSDHTQTNPGCRSSNRKSAAIFVILAVWTRQRRRYITQLVLFALRKRTATGNRTRERLCSRGIALILATLVRAFVLSAALAGALTPVRCLGEDSSKLPERATRELSPELLSLLRQKKTPKYSPIILRVFKEEAELEVWKQDITGHFQILKIYPICRWSGDLGPKMHEGDRQDSRGLLYDYTQIDESEFKLLSCDQHRLSQCLR